MRPLRGPDPNQRGLRERTYESIAPKYSAKFFNG